MSDRQPYSRVYWSFLHDDKSKKARKIIEGRYPARAHTREVAALRGTWLLLLLVHDQSYPSPGILPAGLYQPALDLLIEVGFVRLDGDAFELVGLKGERERRASAATREPRADPSAPQQGPKSDPVGSLAEPSRDKDETSLTQPAGASDPVVVYANLTGGWPAPGAVNWIDQLSERFGDVEVIKAIGEAAKTSGRGQIIGDARTLLEQQGRELQKAEKKAEAAKVAERRIDGMLARRVEWFRNTGKWDPAWGEAPAA